MVNHVLRAKVSPEWRLKPGFGIHKLCPLPLNWGLPSTEVTDTKSMRANFVTPEWKCPLNRGFPKERLHKWDRTGCFSLHVATLNSAKLIFYVKINFARHQHDTERTKTVRGRSRRQLFRPFWGSSLWRNEQRGSAVKFPHILVLPMFLRLVLSILNFLSKTWTSHLDSCLLGDTWHGVTLWVFEFMTGL